MGQFYLHLVDCGFKQLGVQVVKACCGRVWLLRRVGGEVTTNVEKGVLHALHQVGMRPIMQGEQITQGRIKLVDGAVSLDARMRLVNARSAYKACCALVACLGVYFHVAR